jgi:hypothetical protein
MKRHHLETRPFVTCLLVLAVGLAFAVFAGCGGGDDDGGGGTAGCGVEGFTSACTCTDGRTGAQQCLADGTFDECICTGGEAGSAGGGGAGSGGEPGSGGSGGDPGTGGTGGSGGGGGTGGEAGVGGVGGTGGTAGIGGIGGAGGTGGTGGAGGTGGTGGTTAGELHSKCYSDQECEGEMVCHRSGSPLGVNNPGYCTETCFSPMYDCPDPENATARGECGTMGRCYMNCSRAGSTCPEGMQCDQVGSPPMIIGTCNYPPP